MTVRAGRKLQEFADLNRQRRHLEHHRAHLAGTGRGVTDREWDHPPVVVTLAGPWRARESDKILAAWGVPPSHRDLDTFVHFREGGWGVFALPSLPAVYAFLAKASKHAEAVTYLDLLARLALHSQYTLSEALMLILDVVEADQRKYDAPALRAQDWEYVGRYAIDILQARMSRTDQRSVGDAHRVASTIQQLSHTLDEMRLDAAERRLASVRATLALRRAS